MIRCKNHRQVKIEWLTIQRVMVYCYASLLKSVTRIIKDGIGWFSMIWHDVLSSYTIQQGVVASLFHTYSCNFTPTFIKDKLCTVWVSLWLKRQIRWLLNWRATTKEEEEDNSSLSCKHTRMNLNLCIWHDQLSCNSLHLRNCSRFQSLVFFKLIHSYITIAFYII